MHPPGKTSFAPLSFNFNVRAGKDERQVRLLKIRDR